MEKLYCNSVQEEIEALDILLGSVGWRVLKKMAKDHQEYLQGQVNTDVGLHKYQEAGESLSAMRESKKLIGMVKDRLNLLRTNQQGE